MTKFPPPPDPADDTPAQPELASLSQDPEETLHDAEQTGEFAEEIVAESDESDGHTVELPPITDDELLAAAKASLHDEEQMVNAAPGPDGPDPTSDAASAAQPPPPPPGSIGYPTVSPVRRIYRSRHDRKLGGVSAGIAEFFGVDPTIVRLATLVAGITGIGVLVYIAAWFIVPMQPDGYVEAARSTPIANERTMTMAFGIATLALAFGIISGSWTLLALALIGGGVWLLSEHTAAAPAVAGAAAVAGTSKYQAPSYGYEPGHAPFAPTPTAPGMFVPAAPAALSTPVPPKERTPQRVTWIVLSLLALLAAVGLAAATGDWWDVSATRLLGIGVVIIGVGVVIGQIRRGGARGLIPLGILATLALFPVSAVDGLLVDGIGEANHRPTTIAELQTSYQHGIGEMVVDLSAIDFDGRSDSIDIDLGIGELVVIVSEETGGQAVIEATAGEISRELPDTNSVIFDDGLNIKTGTITLAGDNGTLDLHIAVGFGTAELRTADN